jgi:hypothetical protein
MPIVFVHGITVRHERFKRLLHDVQGGFVDAGSELKVTGCFWGDLGRSAAYTGASVPGFFTGIRAVDETAVQQGSAALLMVLLENPLAELVGLRDADGFEIDGMGFRPVPLEVVQRNEAFRAAETPVSTHLTTEASGFTGPHTQLDAGQIAKVVQAVLAEAARANRTLDAVQLTGPISRSITAGLYRAAVAEEDLTGEFRWNGAADVVQAALNDQLGGQRGLFSNLASDAFTLALRRGLRRRIMPGLSLFMGDVMAWFANRSAILNRVDQAVQTADNDGPLVLLGHSLGGVIAFEYCMQADRDIELLATVGSQVGFFGELGVLPAAMRAASSKLEAPPRVGTWRNLYDPDDALAFIAEPIFSDVQDIELDTGAPFPAAHSEYWNLPSTYAKLTAAVMR